jgi:hypothetical protein
MKMNNITVQMCCFVQRFHLAQPLVGSDTRSCRNTAAMAIVFPSTTGYIVRVR